MSLLLDAAKNAKLDVGSEVIVALLYGRQMNKNMLSLQYLHDGILEV
jgi:hypothetical protein